MAFLILTHSPFFTYPTFSIPPPPQRVVSCAVFTCRGTPVSVRGVRGNLRAAIGERGVDGMDLDCSMSI